MKPSKSPERNTFQLNGYIKRCKEEGKEPDENYIRLYTSADELDDKWAESTEHEHDMEWDLRTTDWILEKVRNSDVYAQNLYAAMCNNEFQKKEVFPILAGKTCSYSWRYAGGIIADMKGKGDYIDWYCSGIRDRDSPDNGYVPESVVTEEIHNDLDKLGWSVAPYETSDDI